MCESRVDRERDRDAEKERADNNAGSGESVSGSATGLLVRRVCVNAKRDCACLFTDYRRRTGADASASGLTRTRSRKGKINRVSFYISYSPAIVLTCSLRILSSRAESGVITRTFRIAFFV